MSISKQSKLEQDFPVYQYTDSFDAVIEDLNDKVGILDLAEVFVKPDSKWFEMLFALRDKIVSFFKLKTLANTKKGENGNIGKWEIGARAGIFKIYGKSENEIIFGEDDKHLDFRVSLLYEPCEEKRMIVPILFKRKFKQFELELKR